MPPFSAPYLALCFYCSLYPSQRSTDRVHSYEYISVEVDDEGTGDVTINFRINADGVGLDMTDLPADLKDGDGEPFRMPSFLLTYSLPQDNIEVPMDYNNLGNSAGQPISIDQKTSAALRRPPIISGSVAISISRFSHR